MQGNTYPFSQELSVTTLKLLDLVHNLFFEGNVAIVNMLSELFDSCLHGFRRAQNGAMRCHMLVGLLMKSR